MKILLVDGTMFGRKTGAILEQVEQYIKELDAGFELEIMHFSQYKHQIVDGSPLNDDMKEMIQKFEEADAYIIATPIFQASIPGVLKMHLTSCIRKQCVISPYRLWQMVVRISTI